MSATTYDAPSGSQREATGSLSRMGEEGGGLSDRVVSRNEKVGIINALLARTSCKNTHVREATGSDLLGGMPAIARFASTPVNLCFCAGQGGLAAVLDRLPRVFPFFTAPKAVKRMLVWIRGGPIASLLIELLARRSLCGSHSHQGVSQSLRGTSSVCSASAGVSLFLVSLCTHPTVISRLRRQCSPSYPVQRAQSVCFPCLPLSTSIKRYSRERHSWSLCQCSSELSCPTVLMRLHSTWSSSGSVCDLTWQIRDVCRFSLVEFHALQLGTLLQWLHSAECMLTLRR